MKMIFVWWLLAGCGGPHVCAADADSDGRCDEVDPCPLDPLDDSDGDGSCDSEDLCIGDDRTGDSDGDGLCDDVDPCPLDAPPHDDDGDGVCNAWDFCLGHDSAGDADLDGLCDDVDPCFGTGPDTDGDGVCDDRDPCPLDPADDSDGDGSCDSDDLCVGDDRAGDSDGDGLCDDVDPCPLDAPPHDDDGDGVCNAWDFCLGHDSAGDTDLDGLCDDIDPCFGTGPDTDGDGVCDDRDPCPLDPADDSDGDGSCDSDDLCVGDDRTGDSDEDGVCDDLDACLGDDAIGDTDGDGLCQDRDVCFGQSESDLDGDGLCDEEDLCPETRSLPAPCQPAPEGLAHYWPGDGHLRDVVGGATTTPVGSVSVNLPGRVHRGIDITVPTTSHVVLAPEVLDDLDAFTIAFWVRSTDLGYGLVSAAGAGSTNAFLIFPQITDTEVHIQGAVTRIPAHLNDLLWHHLAISRDAASGAVAAYLDGALLTEWTAATGPIDVQYLVLGQDQDTIGGGFQTNQAFQGRLDELVVYHRVLAADEIARLADPNGLCDVGATTRGGGDAPLCPLTWHVDLDADAGGDGRSVDAPFASLADAAAAAGVGDSVWVLASEHALAQTVDAPAETSWYGGFAGSEADPSERTSQARTRLALTSRAFDLDPWVTIDGFDFHATDTAFRALSSSSPFVVRRSSFEGFTFTSDGGALSATDVHVSECRFTDNVATRFGAATASGRLVVVDSSFEGNAATLDGGAIGRSAVSGSLEVRRSEFRDNEAGDRGGAIGLLTGNPALVVDAWFEDNSAATSGGAIFANSVTSRGSTFLGNAAPVGAAIRTTGALDVVDARLSHHTDPLLSAGGLLRLVQSQVVDQAGSPVLASTGECQAWSSTFTWVEAALFACGSTRMDEIVWVDNTPATPEGTCNSCCAPGGTVDPEDQGLLLDDLDGDGVDEAYLPFGHPCRDAGTVEASSAAPLLPPFWWRALTTSVDQSLDEDPPDMGRHHEPLP